MTASLDGAATGAVSGVNLETPHLASGSYPRGLTALGRAPPWEPRRRSPGPAFPIGTLGFYLSVLLEPGQCLIAHPPLYSASSEPYSLPSHVLSHAISSPVRFSVLTTDEIG